MPTHVRLFESVFGSSEENSINSFDSDCSRFFRNRGQFSHEGMLIEITRTHETMILVGYLVLVRTESSSRPNSVFLLEFRKKSLQLTISDEGRSRVTVVL